MPYNLSLIYTKNPITKSIDLNLSFRITPIVREFAQLILDIQAKVVGGNYSGQETKYTVQTSRDESDQTDGILRFIEPNDGEIIRDIRRNIEANILDTIIIIFDEKDRKEAESIFSQGNNKAIVMLAESDIRI
ncbi:MAG UNVERIFIED_CONTAM: hypothetical protein LVQ98_06170 [Rickettsiaceae bacterium]